MGTVTVGGNDYEILGTLADAQSYLAASVSASAFNNADADLQSRALISVTRAFGAMNWKGTLSAGVVEPLTWPRDGTGVSDDGVTPLAVLYGFYEMAAMVAEDPDVLTQSSSGSNVQRAKGGEAEVWFFRSTLDTATALPFAVHVWLKKFLAGSAGGVGAVFGVDEDFVSVFDQAPERSSGLN
jgi:hypothetical protein